MAEECNFQAKVAFVEWLLDDAELLRCAAFTCSSAELADTGSGSCGAGLLLHCHCKWEHVKRKLALLEPLVQRWSATGTAISCAVARARQRR